MCCELQTNGKFAFVVLFSHLHRSNPQVPQVSDEFRMSINGRPMTSRTSAAWQIANQTLRRGLRTGVMAHLQQPGPVGRSSRERTHKKKTETLSGPINLSPPARQAPRNWRLTAPKIKSSTQPTVRSRPIRNALRALQKRHAGPFPPVRSLVHFPGNPGCASERRRRRRRRRWAIYIYIAAVRSRRANDSCRCAMTWR